MTNLLETSAYFYDLPEELIAQTPVTPRDSSRLLHFDRETGTVEHRIFRDLDSILREGDVLVINNTKVIPARIFGNDDKGRVYEILLLKRLDYTDWEVILKPARKAKIGSQITISEELKLTIMDIKPDNGVRIVKFDFDGVFEDILDRVGNMPLPPYITEKLEDKTRYQTVYAKHDGSAAAPTAGLHFTPELLERLKSKGVETVEVLLHVGLGTFRPVKAQNILEHAMHEEYYKVSEEAADKINTAIKEGRRVIAVGTTSVRTLESASTEDGYVKAGEGNTNIFIYPSYKFKVVKGLITNFHLPESTLIMLVSAFAGYEQTMSLYNLAVSERYRFFSFGDSMIIL